MIYLIIIVLIAILPLAYQKYMGNRAMTFTYINVAGLTLDEIIAIGTKASGSLAGRLTGNAPVVRRSASGATWDAQSRGGILSFQVEALPDGSGYRVGGAASSLKVAEVRIGSDRGIWGLSKAISNSIYRLLGIPKHASSLAHRRKRALRAIANAGSVVQPAANASEERATIPDSPYPS